MGLLGRGISPSQGRYLHTQQHKHRINAHKHHASSGIRTHDHSVQVGDDCSCLSQGGHCDRLGDNIHTIKENTEFMIDASKEVGLEVNAEKSKYMLLSHHQNAGQNHNIKIANKSFENVTQFKYVFWNSNKSKFDSGRN
jgi:hypothetical protein